MEVYEYESRAGINHFQKWYRKLKIPAQTRVMNAMIQLERGNLSCVKWIGVIGEYRINWGPGLRIYLIQDGKEIIVLFCGGDKDSQQRDIAKAKQLHKEYKEEKNATKKRPNHNG